MTSRKRIKGKVVNILGHKVLEAELKSSLRDVLKKRGMSCMLIADKKMTIREKQSLMKDDISYANVYKYAFF